ncbi:MAG: IMPACT family protein [Gemmatimonadota bacterium]
MPSGFAEAQISVKGSRFLARLSPAGESTTAREVLVDRTGAHPDATHHCWAYRVWKNGRVESAGFDAGEPAGTAGRPILGALERADIVGASCIVSRWFGGTKLGTGGLTRAYADAAEGAVTAARQGGLLHAVEPWSAFRIGFPYDSTAAVQRVLARHKARERSAEYGARVALIASVPERSADAFRRELLESTAGTVVATRLDDHLAPRA